MAQKKKKDSDGISLKTVLRMVVLGVVGFIVYLIVQFVVWFHHVIWPYLFLSMESLGLLVVALVGGMFMYWLYYLGLRNSEGAVARPSETWIGSRVHLELWPAWFLALPGRIRRTVRHIPMAMWGNVTWGTFQRRNGLAAPLYRRLLGAGDAGMALHGLHGFPVVPTTVGVTKIVRWNDTTGLKQLQECMERLENRWGCQRIRLILMGTMFVKIKAYRKAPLNRSVSADHLLGETFDGQLTPEELDDLDDGEEDSDGKTPYEEGGW